MQQAISADVLVPLGAGAAVLLLALFVVLIRSRRKRAAGPASADPVAEPSAADWTGEAASGPSDPTPARRAVVEPATPQPVRSSAVTQPATVAEAVAARQAAATPEADPAPLSIRADQPDTRTAVAETTPTHADAVTSPTAERPAEPAVDRRCEPVPGAPAAASVAATTSTEPAAFLDRPAAEEPAEAGPTNWAEPPVVRPLFAGSSRTVADAVTQALGSRATAAGRAEAAAEGTAPERAADRPKDARPRADARDRLLAVLLDDPARAVGAAADLERCREQLERLTDAVRHEREVLVAVLQRLAEAGLTISQIARLSDLPAEEVRTLLGRSTRRG